MGKQGGYLDDLAYLFGVSGVVGAYPAVDQRDGGSDAVGEVVAYEQADFVAFGVGQKGQETAA